MKTRYLLIIGIISLGLFVPSISYGWWESQSFEELLEQSETIFVGTIITITPVAVEYQSPIARNGTIKETIGPEIMTLEEYAVNVEEYLKNPQNSDTMNVLRATVGGVPSGPAKISGFEIGDRVLFYLPTDEKQTDFPMQYLPESFKIPKQCDAKTILDQTELEFGNKFRIIQNGIPIDDNFAANIPIEFVYYQGYHKLGERNFDVHFKIIKLEENNKNQTVIDETVNIEFKPCEWKSVANLEFIPSSGKYSMSIERANSGSFRGFTVIENTHSPRILVNDNLSPEELEDMQKRRIGEGGVNPDHRNILGGPHIPSSGQSYDGLILVFLIIGISISFILGMIYWWKIK